MDKLADVAQIPGDREAWTDVEGRPLTRCLFLRSKKSSVCRSYHLKEPRPQRRKETRGGGAQQRSLLSTQHWKSPPCCQCSRWLLEPSLRRRLARHLIPRVVMTKVPCTYLAPLRCTALTKIRPILSTLLRLLLLRNSLTLEDLSTFPTKLGSLLNAGISCSA